MNSNTSVWPFKRGPMTAFFWTQFLGALNDNLFKNALFILVAFGTLGSMGFGNGALINIGAGLFVLPFVLFAGVASQLADKYDRAWLVQRIKIAEVLIMVVGAVALFTSSLLLSLFALFLMGTQSALFGPVKYAVLPQLVPANRLVAANGLVEAGTFLAILLGTIIGGLLVHNGTVIPLAIAVVFIAIAGFRCAKSMPSIPALNATQRVSFRPLKDTTGALKLARKDGSVFRAILGVSWFWTYGSVVMAQFPSYVHDVLLADGAVVTGLLTAFAIGIAAGSLLCAPFAKRGLELALVPIGAAGMGLFALDFANVSAALQVETARPFSQFVAQPAGIRILADLTMMAVSSGLFVVPLYTQLQTRSSEAQRASIVAANNVMNALFMVAGALVCAVLLSVGASVVGLLYGVAVLSIVVALVSAYAARYLLLRLGVYSLVHCLYDLRKGDLHNVPNRGGALLICNHVSFVDAVIIAATVHRPIRFVMDWRIYHTPLLHWLFRLVRVIPIAPAKVDEQVLEQAYDSIATALANGELVCLFPEGRLSSDGAMTSFKGGVERIVKRTPVPVIPCALSGLWGSVFSRAPQRRLAGFPWKFRARVAVTGSAPVLPHAVDTNGLYNRVARLRELGT